MNDSQSLAEAFRKIEQGIQQLGQQQRNAAVWIREGLQQVTDRVAALEERLALSVVKEAYLVEEAAKQLKRKPWTVRQWCNHRQVPGAYKGTDGQWRIPHEALLRLQKEGPLPLRLRAG